MCGFDCLSDYTALIQLLVGSVFFANYFSSNETVFEEDVKSLRASLKKKVFYTTLITSYIPCPSKEWKTEWFDGTKRQRKSLMFVLAIYGCLVLFYCANCYRSGCVIQQNILTFGLGLSTCVVFLYLVFILFFYGKHEYVTWHTHLGWFVMLSCIICFAFSFFSIVSFFDRISDWVNCFVLVNLIIWSGIYIKQFVYIWIVREKIKELKKIAYSTQLNSAFNLSEKLQCVFKWLGEEKDADERSIIIELCVSELKDNINYIEVGRVENKETKELEIRPIPLTKVEVEKLKQEIIKQAKDKILKKSEKDKLIDNIKEVVEISTTSTDEESPKKSDQEKETLQNIVDALYIHGFDVRKIQQDDQGTCNSN